MLDPNSVAAIVSAIGASAAAVAAWCALRPAQRAAKAAEEQTEVQRGLMHQAAQPYVWADIQPDDRRDTLLSLVLGNAGPTVARNVRVVVEPHIPAEPNAAEKITVVQRRLREGILSLAPGRTIRWHLGRSAALLEDKEDATVYRIRVTGEGPYGELEPAETEVRLSDWREQLESPDGSLHLIRKETQSLSEAVKSLKQAD